MTVIVNGNQTASTQTGGTCRCRLLCIYMAAIDRPLLIAGTTQGPQGISLQTDPAVFKTAWWLGSAADNNMGTVAYPGLDLIAPGMVPDSWADEGWFRLIQGGQNYILDQACQFISTPLFSIENAVISIGFAEY